MGDEVSATEILVTGGTGTLGVGVVDALLDGGHRVRVLSRKARPSDDRRDLSWAVGDLDSGAGIEDAVAGVAAIVHCATAIDKSDIAATRRLVEAAARAGGIHIVYISIVGVDVVPLFYYKAKLQIERDLEASSVPFTILRATQFHDLVLRLFTTQRRLPVTIVPSGTSFQPISVRDVARRLAELVDAGPSGRVADIGGPEVRGADDLARAYLAAAGRKRRVVNLPLPGRTAKAYRAGGHLTPASRYGTGTFEEFLATTVR